MTSTTLLTLILLALAAAVGVYACMRRPEPPHRTQHMPFGFRRINPSRTRYEWWTGSHWLDADCFSHLLLDRARANNEQHIRLLNQYQVTNEPPLFP